MNNIIFVNLTSSYPIAFSANNSKVEFIARGLIEQGNSVTTFNSCLVGSRGVRELKQGVTDFGFEYYLFPEKSVMHGWSNSKLLFRLLRDKKSKTGKNIAFVGMDYFPTMMLAIIFAKIRGYKVVTLFHEWDIVCKQLNFFYKIDAYLKDWFFGWFMNGIFPISHFLEQKARRFHKPMAILPILADYRLPRISSYKGGNNFSFCGHAGYLLRYNLIFNSFVKVVQKKSSATLTLITFGYDWQIEQIKERVRKLGIADNVIIKSQLTTEELNVVYDESLALLIPLQPDTDQDKARFSQKIAEYTASGRPIITTAVGEIPYYFTHDKDAVICDYSDDSYAEAMLDLLEHKDKATLIGKNGRECGEKYFDYRVNGVLVNEFLNKI